MLRTADLEISIHWPRDRVPVSLIVDDPMPGLNPMTDHEPGETHRPVIPNLVLRRFADLADRHGMRGKFSVVPWPLALGRLDRPETLPEPAQAALPEFLAIVRERVAPRFDLTCEFLTHSRAIDVRLGLPLAVSERQWASTASAEEFADVFTLATHILAKVGLPMDGVTSPWNSGQDNEAAYAAGVALAARRRGANLPWYFLHCATTLDVLPRITAEGDGTPVASLVAGAVTDPGWETQYGRPEASAALLDPDGGGRLAELIRGGLPAVFLTHWQSLFGNGSYGGLHALDLVGQRLAAGFGQRLEWVPLHRHAELALACHGLEVLQEDEGGSGPAAVRFQARWHATRAGVRLRPRSDRGRGWLVGPVAWGRVPLATRASGDGVWVEAPLTDGVLRFG